MTDQSAIPADLVPWLDADMREFLDGLSATRRRRYVKPIEQATDRDIREWRIANTLAMLREERRR